MIQNIFSKPELFWFFLGLVLFLLELVLPGFFIFFFGLGAWVTALICLIAEPGTNLQMVIFAVISVISLITLRKNLQKKFFSSNDVDSNKIEDEFTGNEALALTDIGDKKIGRVEFKGISWKAEAESEIKEGQRVIIMKKENFKLFVKPKNN